MLRMLCLTDLLFATQLGMLMWEVLTGRAPFAAGMVTTAGGPVFMLQNTQ